MFLTCEQIKDIASTFPAYVTINGETYDLVQTVHNGNGFSVVYENCGFCIRMVTEKGNHLWLEKVYQGQFTLNYDFCYAKKYKTRTAAEKVLSAMLKAGHFETKNGHL